MMPISTLSRQRHRLKAAFMLKQIKKTSTLLFRQKAPGLEDLVCKLCIYKPVFAAIATYWGSWQPDRR
jgi:hypothetical protein